MKPQSRTMFALALVVAAGAPFAVSSVIEDAYAAPDARPLSAVDAAVVDKQVRGICAAPGVVPKVYARDAADQTLASVPVVLYHRITNKDSPSHEVTRPELFREHLRWLKAEGYETITVSQLTDYMNGKGMIPAKPIVLTFDDGWKDNVEAAQTMKEFGFGATFYVISGFFDNRMYFDEQELKTLAADPKFEIGSHMHTHFVKWENDLTKLELCTMATEIAASKRILEQTIGKPIVSLAWPYGYYRPEAVTVANQVGYSSTMHVNRDTFNRPGQSALYTKRLNVDGTCPLSDFQTMVKTQKLKECS